MRQSLALSTSITLGLSTNDFPCLVEPMGDKVMLSTLQHQQKTLCTYPIGMRQSLALSTSITLGFSTKPLGVPIAFVVILSTLKIIQHTLVQFLCMESLQGNSSI